MKFDFKDLQQKNEKKINIKSNNTLLMEERATLLSLTNREIKDCELLKTTMLLLQSNTSHKPLLS